MVMEALTQYDRRSPFEALGTKITETDVDAILAQAGLDFEVGTFVPVVNGHEAVGHVGIQRLDTGKTFGFGKKGYTIVQNRQAFAFVEDLLGSGQVQIESAGTFKGGARVWIQAKVAQPIAVPGDEVDAYLTISTSHDGSGSLQAVYGFLRLACTNQFPALVREAASVWRHRHSTHVLAKADQAKAILGLAPKVIDGFETEVRRLIETEVTDRQFRSIVQSVLPITDFQTPRQRRNVEEQREAVRAMYASEIDGGAFRGTGWGAVNAVNSWAQWAKPVKSTGDRANRQAVRTLDGTFGALTTRVAEMVLS